jgi:hypothetical protein
MTQGDCGAHSQEQPQSGPLAIPVLRRHLILKCSQFFRRVSDDLFHRGQLVEFNTNERFRQAGFQLQSAGPAAIL